MSFDSNLIDNRQRRRRNHRRFGPWVYGLLHLVDNLRFPFYRKLTERLGGDMVLSFEIRSFV